MASSTRRDTVCTPDQVTIIIIYKFYLYTSFGHYSDFIACFGLLIPKRGSCMVWEINMGVCPRLDFENIMLFNCLGYNFNIYGVFEF